MRGIGILMLSVLVCGAASAQEHTIKFATVAPEGTAWMNVMRDFEKAVEEATGGRVAFRIYPGATQGDERVVLRKIRAGQLHAGGFTGVAMGEIASKVRILDSPFLFENYREVDHILEKFDAEFRQAFLEGGYVLLGWAEVGFVYVFTNSAISRPEDLRSLKMWSWEGDPIAEALFREFNISPIPLAMPDVMTSLQTGLIDAFYSPPYAALMLQWYTRAKFMIDVRLSDAAGAVLVSRRVFEKLPPDIQTIMLNLGKQHFRRLTEISREQNASALEEMKKRGLKVIQPKEADYKEYKETSAVVRRKLVGSVYTEDFLKRVEQALEEFRRNSKSSP